MKVVNLNKVRKSKARAQRRKTADENARVFGRTKQEKQAQETRKTNAEKFLDGHKREP